METGIMDLAAIPRDYPQFGKSVWNTGRSYRSVFGDQGAPCSCDSGGSCSGENCASGGDGGCSCSKSGNPTGSGGCASKSSRGITGSSRKRGQAGSLQGGGGSSHDPWGQIGGVDPPVEPWGQVEAEKCSPSCWSKWANAIDKCERKPWQNLLTVEGYFEWHFACSAALSTYYLLCPTPPCPWINAPWPDNPLPGFFSCFGESERISEEVDESGDKKKDADKRAHCFANCCMLTSGGGSVEGMAWYIAIALKEWSDIWITGGNSIDQSRDDMMANYNGMVCAKEISDAIGGEGGIPASMSNAAVEACKFCCENAHPE